MYYADTGLTVTATNSVGTWNNWINGTTTAVTNPTVAVWTTWTNNTTAATTFGTVGTAWGYWQDASAVAVELSEEEKERRRIAAVERQAREDAAYAAYLEATKRAAALLVEVLDRDQAKEYAERERFHVQVRKPGEAGLRTFRICRGKAGNVRELNDSGQEVARYCVHLFDGSPDEDTMVAQKLMLETDPEQFIRRANRTPLHPQGVAA